MGLSSNFKVDWKEIYITVGKKIIIIGGGIAGLTAGIYGQKHGFNTEIFEMHSIPGGQCTAWERKGYRFDYCIAWLMGSRCGSMNRIWKELGALTEDISIIEPEIFVKYINRSSQEFLFYKDPKKWEEYLRQIAPEDNQSITRMFSIVDKLSFSGETEEFMKPQIFRRNLPMLRELISMWRFIMPIIRYGKSSVQYFFEDMGFQNQFLKDSLKKILDYNDSFSAIGFLMMLSLFKDKNAGYPIGGSLDFALRIAQRYKDMGGKFLPGRRVQKILIENGRAVGIQLEDDNKYKSDYVIAACDLHTVIYKMLEGQFIPEDVQNAFDNWPVFQPLVQVSFGIKKEIREKQMSVKYLIPVKFGSTETDSYSIFNYSFDPKTAPRGKTTIVIRFESPYDLWEQLKAEEYKEEKKAIIKDSIELLERAYPDITKDIEVVNVASPLTNIKYTGVYRAAYEGFLPTINNINKTISPIIKDLDHFMLAGQWLFPGGGLPPAALSGKWAIEEIARRER